MHKARKRFGQHFLSDERVIERIIRVIAPKPGDHMVEIGPGLGCITDYLVTKVKRLDLIEIDRDLVSLLRDRYGQYAHVHIHEADALSFDFSSLAKQGTLLRVVGNLPYNISSPLLFRMLSFVNHIEDMHFMLQEDLVDRIVAASGSRIYGRLSVMVQCDCMTEKIFSIGPEAFDPPPKVDSAVVRLLPCVRWPIDDRSLFAALVSQAFQWRRKTMRHTLKVFLNQDVDTCFSEECLLRPEQLSVENFVRIANIVYNVMGENDKG